MRNFITRLIRLCRLRATWPGTDHVRARAGPRRGLALVAAALAMALPSRQAAAQFFECPPYIRIAPIDSVFYQDSVAVQVTWGEDDMYQNPGTGESCVSQSRVQDSSTFQLRLNGVTKSLTVSAAQASGVVRIVLDRQSNVLIASIVDWYAQANADTLVFWADQRRPVVSLAPYNPDHQAMGQCAMSCFSATYVQSTVPYFTLDQPRSITLSYRGDRAAPRPLLAVDVSRRTGAPTPQEYHLKAQVQWSGSAWSVVRFTNGDTLLRFTGSSTTQRLAAHADIAGTGAVTGAYPLRFVVTAKYDAVKLPADTVSSRLVIVDDRTSPYGRGWRIANLQRLHVQIDGSMLLAEGDGSALYFAKACTPSCSFTSPKGDYSKLSVAGSGGSTSYTRAFPDSSSATFDSAGRLTRVQNRFGEKVQFTYDQLGRLSRMYDPFRKFSGGSNAYYLELAYGGGGISIREPAQGNPADTARITYVRIAADSTARLLAIVDPDGDSTRFAYDDFLRLSTITDRRGGVSRFFHHEATWTVDSVQGPQVPLDAGNGTEDTNASPSTTRFRPWQRVTVVTGSTVSTPASVIGSDTVRAEVTDALGRRTRFTVGRFGQPVVTTMPDGRSTRVYYDAVTGALPDSVRDADSLVTKYTWLATGQLQSVRQPTGHVVFLYYDRGVPYQKSETGLPAVVSNVRAGGHVDSTWLSGIAGSATHFAYDSATFYRLKRITDPDGHVTTLHYDAVFGNLDSTLVPGNRWTRTRFDRFGRDSALARPTAPIQRLGYDLLNRATAVYNGVDSLPLRYGYDGLFLVRVEDPKQQVYRFARNALGWTTREYDPADTVNRFLSFRYDREGRVTSTTNRRGQRIDIRYDSVGRVISRRQGTALLDSTEYVRTSAGSKVTVINENARTAYHARSNGWLDSVVTRIGARRYRTRYAPDSLFRLDSMQVVDSAGFAVFASRRFAYTASSGLLDTVQFVGKTISVLRDREWRDTVIRWEAGSTRTQVWNDIHRLARYALTANGPAEFLDRQFAYDSLARLTEMASASQEARRFEYDALGRLRAVRAPQTLPVYCAPADGGSGYGNCGGVTVWNAVESNSYDGAGNRAVAGDTARYAPGNRALRFAGDSMQYDLDGNLSWRKTLASGRIVTYHWSAHGLLDSVHVGSVGIRYLYDGEGRLVMRRRNGTLERYYLWNGAQLLAQLDGAGARLAEYVDLPGALDVPLAVLSDSGGGHKVRYLSIDPTGSIREVVDAGAGVVDQANTYGAWGTVTQSGQSASVLLWKGLLYESDSTRLYYMRNRWYDPQSGRFVSEDPIRLVGGDNFYAFARNEPINQVDPLGLCPPMIEVEKGVFACPGGHRLAGVTTTASFGGSWGGGFGGVPGLGGGGENASREADEMVVASADVLESSSESSPGQPATHRLVTRFTGLNRCPKDIYIHVRSKAHGGEEVWQMRRIRVRFGKPLEGPVLGMYNGTYASALTAFVAVPAQGRANCMNGLVTLVATHPSLRGR